jgi:hypothetical protein
MIFVPVKTENELEGKNGLQSVVRMLDIINLKKAFPKAPAQCHSAY